MPEKTTLNKKRETKKNAMCIMIIRGSRDCTVEYFDYVSL